MDLHVCIDSWILRGLMDSTWILYGFVYRYLTNHCKKNLQLLVVENPSRADEGSSADDSGHLEDPVSRVNLTMMVMVMVVMVVMMMMMIIVIVIVIGQMISILMTTRI